MDFEVVESKVRWDVRVRFMVGEGFVDVGLYRRRGVGMRSDAFSRGFEYYVVGMVAVMLSRGLLNK